MSVCYQIAKRLVRLTGMKKLFQLPQDELLKKAEQMNRKRQFHMPKDTKARRAHDPLLLRLGRGALCLRKALCGRL